MAETGQQYLDRLLRDRLAPILAAREQAIAAEARAVLAALEDDDDPITWLCDLGDHDGCDGYACECCARGHQPAGGWHQ